MSAIGVRIAILLTAILAGMGYANAQMGGGFSVGSGSAANRPKITVHGVVLDRVTQQPIARALVDGMFDAVLTDNEGRFELKLPEGGANLQVRRPGYHVPNMAPHFINVSSTTPDLTFYLTPDAGVSGHVSVTGDDDPTFIHLTAYRKTVVTGHERWMRVGFTTVESDGTFRFPQLEAPGSYIFCSNPSRTAATGNGKQTGYSSRCFPGATDFTSVTPLQLAAGQQAQFDVDLEMQPFYNVAISLPTGDNMPSIQIYDRGGLSVPVPTLRRRGPGTMEFSLPNGSYYAEARTWTPQQMYGRVDFTVANGPLQLGMVLAPLHPIPVLIHKEFTENASSNAGPTIQIGMTGDSNPGMQLMLQQTGKVMTSGSGGGLRHVNGGGPEAFEMDAIPGRWRILTYAYQGYVSSMTSGGIDLIRDPLVIGAGSSVQPIEVTMRNDGGQIQCSVSGANSAPSTTDPNGQEPSYSVVAVAQFPAAMPINLTSALRGHPGIISNLAPGDYRVAAFDAVPTIDLDDPDQLARVMANSQIAHVEPNGTATVQVGLTSLSSLDSPGGTQ